MCKLQQKCTILRILWIRDVFWILVFNFYLNFRGRYKTLLIDPMASSCLSVHDEVIVIFFSSRQAGWLFLCILFYTVAHRKVPRPAKGQKMTKRICDNFSSFQKRFWKIKSLIPALSSKRSRLRQFGKCFCLCFWGNWRQNNFLLRFSNL